MKKFLLFVVAALMAGSASAQKISKKSDVSVKKVTKREVVANQFKKAQLGSIRMLPQLKETVPVLTINGEKVVKAENKKFKKTMTSSSRRAFAAAYTGTCGGSAGSQKWTMTPTFVTDANEQEYAAFEDLLPNVFNGIDHLYLLYSISGTKITVQPQYVVTVTLTSGDQYDIWVANWTSASVDGVIELTLTDDGELTMEPAYVAYVAFPVDTESFSYDTALGYWDYFQNIKYKDAATVSAPSVSYTSEDAIFYTGITSDGYTFIHQHVLLPAYAPVSFTNLTTDDADSWSWEAYTLGYQAGATEEEDGTYFNDKLIASADTRDFSFTTEGGEEYTSPILKGSYQGQESAPYVGFDDTEDGIAIAYGGADASGWAFSDERIPILSRADTKNGLTGIVNASGESKYSALVFYQGKPTAPFYFEGINLFVYSFVKVADVVNLKCKIYKVERDGSGIPSLGELVAESDLDQTSLETSSWNDTAQLKWKNFKSTDETGTVFNIDYFFVDYDFAVVFDGWNNGTFTGGVLGDEDISNSTISNTSVIIASSGKESSLAYYGHAFVGFDGAAYGYLQTTDDTNLTIPGAGGQASINVKPMIVVKDPETLQPTTRLFFEEAITDTDRDEDYDEDGWPVWLGLKIDDHYALDGDGYLEPGGNFDLILSAEALPSDVESRSATITFIQEGARLTVTVTQTGSGSGSGISTVVTKIDNNAPAYNVAGQRVNKNFKGLVVKDGRKFMNK